ncbi:MAG TPA: ATP-binding protein [Sedimentisphaerales bacterium]|nr:ATP-binding protein [Sedimentisphaerales bacterium]HNU31218.1 ATP-binding protein [Sedimentisphaerales bacterium]
MIVAIASGKGGTGKTTVATNLARVASEMGRVVRYIDCDVEEPNGHIFLKPEIAERRDIPMEIPRVDPPKCNGCGRCGKICQYNAIVCIQNQVLVFNKLCHSCGGCWRVCPTGAITPAPMKIGEIEIGRSHGVNVVTGRLEIGSVATPALIRRAREFADANGLTILDAPPGTSCPVVTSLRGADFVLLVTEPTPFGLHDLTLAVELTRELGLPFGVAINRDGIGDDRVERYCQAQNIDILLRLPDDRRIAEAYSCGAMIVGALPEYRRVFVELANAVESRGR